MVAHELAMLEIIASVGKIQGIEVHWLVTRTQSLLEMDVLATPAINYVILDAAIRDLGLTPAIQQHGNLGSSQHGLRLMIEVAPEWQPPIKR
jgi:hypothetical protein